MINELKYNKIKNVQPPTQIEGGRYIYAVKNL